MDFADFLQEMLGITTDYGIVQIEKFEHPKLIKIHLKYLPNKYRLGAEEYPIYDLAPVREWQHLSWFDYKCMLSCRLPRYINKEEKVKTIEPVFAAQGRGYTHQFSAHILSHLREVQVQSLVANLLQTSDYIVRSVMEDAVERGLDIRGEIFDFTHISIDEKAFAKGHEYATIVVDSKKNCVLDMGEGRSESNTKLLFYCLNSEEKQAQIQQVNMDMWKPYINTIEEIAPQAKIVHDKFHLFQKLSEAIDKTRKKELKELEDKSLLLKQKYTVLKNAETRTQHQQLAFEAIDKANLRTAQAWHIRENFKTIFNSGTIPEIVSNYHQWIENSLASGLEEIIKVVHTFERHRQGILNAIITQSSSGKHENLNGKIQALLAKARGFQNFDRFRINVLFYFANLSF